MRQRCDKCIHMHVSKVHISDAIWWLVPSAELIVGCRALLLPKHDADALADHSKKQHAKLGMKGDQAPDLSKIQTEVQGCLRGLQGEMDEVFATFGEGYMQQYSGKHVA